MDLSRGHTTFERFLHTGSLDKHGYFVYFYSWVLDLSATICRWIRTAGHLLHVFQTRSINPNMSKLTDYCTPFYRGMLSHESSVHDNRKRSIRLRLLDRQTGPEYAVCLWFIVNLVNVN